MLSAGYGNDSESVLPVSVSKPITSFLTVVDIVHHSSYSVESTEVSRTFTAAMLWAKQSPSFVTKLAKLSADIEAFILLTVTLFVIASPPTVPRLRVRLSDVERWSKLLGIFTTPFFIEHRPNVYQIKSNVNNFVNNL